MITISRPLWANFVTPNKERYDSLTCGYFLIGKRFPYRIRWVFRWGLTWRKPNEWWDKPSRYQLAREWSMYYAHRARDAMMKSAIGRLALVAVYPKPHYSLIRYTGYKRALVWTAIFVWGPKPKPLYLP